MPQDTPTPQYNNPHTAAIDRLKGRRKDAGKGLTRRIDKKIGNVRSKEYLYTQKNRPADQLPFDTQAESEQLNARKKAANQRGSVDQRSDATVSEYGFGQDPTANPYSRANLLQKAYQSTRLRTTNSFASRGQLYSGALGTKQDSNFTDYGQSLDQEERDYARKMQGYEDERLGIGDTEFAEITASEGQAIARAEATPPEDPGPKPKSVKKWTQKRVRKYLGLRGKGKDKKADDIRKELQALGAWKPSKVKQTRKKLRKK